MAALFSSGPFSAHVIKVSYKFHKFVTARPDTGAVLKNGPSVTLEKEWCWPTDHCDRVSTTLDVNLTIAFCNLGLGEIG
jgi:hypothetical protein